MMEGPKKGHINDAQISNLLAGLGLAVAVVALILENAA